MQDFRWSDLDHERHLIRVERALLAAGAASAEDRVGHPLGAAGVVASDRRLTVLTHPVVLPSSDSGSLTVQVSVTGVPYQPPEPGLAGLSVAEMRGGVVSAMIVIVRLFVSDPSRLLARTLNVAVPPAVGVPGISPEARQRQPVRQRPRRDRVAAAGAAPALSWKSYALPGVPSGGALEMLGAAPS